MEDKQASLSDSLKWIRAYRKANSLELSPSILDYMKKELLQQLGEFFPSAKEGDKQTKQAQDRPKVKKSRDQVELELRQLIKSNANWQTIAEKAWELFKEHPTDQTGANLIEIAFLYGGLEESSRVLHKLLETESNEIYEKVHPAIRAQILCFIWRRHKESKVWLYLADHQHDNWLQNFEKLLLFFLIRKEMASSLAWLYFRSHQKSIEQGVKEIGKQIKVTLSGVNLLAARLAAQLGRAEEAVELINTISPEDTEYKGGLQLLYNLGTHPEFFKKSRYFARLSQARSWQTKINFLESFLEQIKTIDPAPIEDLLALNALLDTPLQWFPEETAAWEQLSSLLIRYADQHKKLPSLFKIFMDRTYILEETELELSLWRPLSQYDGPVHNLIPLAAIAKIHVFLSTLSVFNEEIVFAARRQLMQFDKKHLQKPQGYQSWSTVWEWLIGSIEKNKYLSGPKKRLFLTFALACKDPHMLSCDEVESYLKIRQTKPPTYALEEFQQLAQKKNAKELEILTILKPKCSSQHFINEELKRLWILSVRRDKSDLAWRTISVLLNRCSLPKPIQLAWEISGENKKHYPFVVPTPRQIDQCLIGFEPEEVRLIWACVKLGAQIPILLSQVDKMIQIDKFSFGHFRVKENNKITKALDSIKWLGTPKRDYSLSGQSGNKVYATPAFAEIVLPNPWNHLVAVICHRLGIGSWKWRLSYLNQAISKLKPNPTHGWQPFPKEHALGKWIKTLESEQKNAWQDLSHICSRLSDEKGFRALSCFVVRLATLIHPSHHLAIYSLKKMRAPIYLIWDLEAWILSPAYSELRTEMQWEHEVGIPPSLQKDPLLG